MNDLQVFNLFGELAVFSQGQGDILKDYAVGNMYCI